MLVMDQPCDDMLFGPVTQKESIHSSISNNNGEEQYRSRIAAIPVLSSTDQTGRSSSSKSIHNEYMSVPHAQQIVKLPPGRRDRSLILGNPIAKAMLLTALMVETGSLPELKISLSVS
jgi:hypothetical protein